MVDTTTDRDRDPRSPAFLGWEPVLLQDATPAHIAGELARRCAGLVEMAAEHERRALASRSAAAVGLQVGALDALRAETASLHQATSALLNHDPSSADLHAARMAEVEVSGAAARVGEHLEHLRTGARP